RKEAAESLRQAQEVLAAVATEESDVGIVLFSALKKIGVGDVAAAIKDWAATPEEAEAEALAQQQAAELRAQAQAEAEGE
ncbi:MAG: hypothetical protein RLZZ369_417, partial [Pseudomonadota bacterium]